MKAVESALHTAGTPVAPAELAKQFARAKPADILEILQTLRCAARTPVGRFGN